MALIDDIKAALRVTSPKMDVEVQSLIDAAIADMKRVGVRDSLVEQDSITGLPKMAVVLYCKANFGYDNSEADRFMDSYRETVVSLMNSTAYNSSYGDGS